MNQVLRNLSLPAAFVAIAPTAFLFSQSAGEPHSGKTAEQAYKNVQVLKNVPAGELIPAMQFISASLGVECGYCHVEGHFEADDKKPKQTARKMIQMMASINQQNFEGHREVTCNTCHQGQVNPAAVPQITEKLSPTPLSRSGEKQPAVNMPGPDQLMAGYVKAVGGAPALLKLSTRVIEGSADFGGRQLPVTVYQKAPNKRLVVIHLQGGESLTGFDGQQGWLQIPGRPVREMSATEIEGAKLDSDLQFPLHLKELSPELRPGPPETISGHDTYQLISGTPSEPRLRLFFDQQTGLLKRLVRYTDSPLGLIPLRQDYEDYRPVDGVQVPFRQTTARPSGKFTIQANDVKQGVVIEDSKFLKPASERSPEPPTQPKQ